MDTTMAETPAEERETIKITAEQLGLIQSDTKDGHLEMDLGNLLVVDPSPPDAAALQSDPEATCLKMATTLTQALLARLFSLPSEAAPVGRVAQLPKPTSRLPRSKPVPKPRPPTKWEKFAQMKGIQKHKRSKLTFDENAGEYRRRFGYKRAGDTEDILIVDAKSTDQPGEDPFGAMKAEKRARVKSQEKNQVANLRQAAKLRGGPAALPPSLRLSASLPEHGKGRPIKRKELRDDIKVASRQAGISTASMGKFDRRLPGEKDGDRAPAGKRRKFEPVVSRGETGKTLNVVDKILRKNSEALIDVTKAIGKFEADAREGRAPAPGSGGAAAAGGKGKKGGKGAKGAGAAAGAAKGKGAKGAPKPGAAGGRSPGGAYGGAGKGGKGAKGRGGGNTGGRPDRPKGTKGGNGAGPRR